METMPQNGHVMLNHVFWGLNVVLQFIVDGLVMGHEKNIAAANANAFPLQQESLLKTGNQ